MPIQDRFLLVLTIVPRLGEEADAWAETGESSSESALHRPHMEVSLHLTFDPSRLPRCLYDVAAVLHQTCRHEIEHLMDEGLLAVSGPPSSARRLPHQESWQSSTRIAHWLNVRRRMFPADSVTKGMWDRLDRRLLRESSDPKCRTLQYMVSPREMHAFVMGFHAEAMFRGVPWDTPMREYVAAMLHDNVMTDQEAEAAQQMMTQWASQVIPHAARRALLTMGG